MSQPGRPSKFTPERCAAIIDSIACCVPYIIAAEANGICEETLYDWIRTGRADTANGLDTEFSRFSESLKQVEQNRIKQHISKISAGVDKWQSDAWILERRWWKHFSSSAAVIDFEKRLKQMEQDKDKSDG